MIARAGSGWQTVLADLSLILFMVMAAAVSDAPAGQAAALPPAVLAPAVPAISDPVALWRAAPGGPDLPQWLAGQPNDPRLRLTLYAEPAAAPAALALAAAIRRPARVVLEPGLGSAPFAALTYDLAPTKENQ